MRDEVRHGEKIMANLFSCKGYHLPRIEEWMNRWKFKDYFFGAQYFLAAKVYPYARDRAFIQTSGCVFIGEEVHPSVPLMYTGSEHVTCMGLPPPKLTSQLKAGIEDQVQRRKDKYIHPIPWNLMLIFKIVCYPVKLISLNSYLSMERAVKFNNFLGKQAQMLDRWIPNRFNSLVLNVWYSLKRALSV